MAVIIRTQCLLCVSLIRVNIKAAGVGSEVSSDVTLLDYIRNHAELRGTKYMCREGGCGACIVSAVRCPGAEPSAVNSCLVSITSCQDWEVTTVEKVGNKLDGYHPIQTTLAEHNGTQCGYCTPGWVMAMYGLTKTKKKLTQLEIEKSFGSNVCRCTGYRPILEAFKKFATDSFCKDLPDIEDMKICNQSKGDCRQICEEEEWCMLSKVDVTQNTFYILLKDGKKWFKAKSVPEIFEILHAEGDDSYMLVAGNTAKGAYPIFEYPKILIEISSVNELKGYLVDQNLVIGSGVTLTELLEIFKLMSQEEYFEYLSVFYDHLELVAHIAVRNIGTIAGNLMIKHQHNDFPSDIFLMLETVGAQLTIINSNGVRRTVSMQEFLKTNMNAKVILKVLLPPLNQETKIVTYKVMPRAQNSHAIINAGFFYKINKSNNIISQARIVYGGLSPSFMRASKTEEFLTGKNIFTNDTLHEAINYLNNEIVATEEPPQLSAKYRKQLAINLFYKGLLQLCPSNKLNPRHRSGAIRIKESRPVSCGGQIFDTDPTMWPVNKPVHKLEALIQCSGEAPYSEDLPSLPREVFGAFVLSTVPSGEIESMNAVKALSYPGVLEIYTAKNIPGINSFVPPGTIFFPKNEEILLEKEIKFYNQPVAIIVADTQEIANRVAKLVDIKYKHVKEPVVDIKEAIKDPKRNTYKNAVPPTDKGKNISRVLKGQHTIYGQYHFTMETLVCVSKPTEEGLEVHAATQWMDGVQEMTAKALNMDINKVDVHVTRLGGAYGIKITRESQIAVACSIVAKKLNRPCRFIQSLPTNMRAIGKRLPCTRTFEVGVDDKGEIQYINYDIYSDNGCFINENFAAFGSSVYNNCYNTKRWNYKSIDTVTDTAKNSWCRSPGTLENIAMAEMLMEQIAYQMSLDPLEVRLTNLDNEQFGDLKGMIEDLKKTAKYNERRSAVNQFNKENRWKKRGLRFSLSRWPPLGTQYFDVTLSVYHGDGTVAITHSGIEMGQGVNTKAAQIAAYILKIPLGKVQIKGNNTMIAPNGFVSGGSLTSQNVGVGVQRACEELLKRLDPVKQTMNNPSWEALIKKAFEMGIDLQSHGFINQEVTQTYNVFGVALAEVEIDVLTGEFEILRVDLTQDVGRSVSPEIDVGQVEGAFIMGLGYWTTERLNYDEKTGEILTDRTWNYYVPQARDIPQDFRITFKKNSYSDDRFLGAKASGEPPICLSVVIAFALREAISEARAEAGIPMNNWFNIDGPFTVEQICLAAETKMDAFTF